jgi:hypothetical protein
VTSRGLKTKLQTLDSEASAALNFFSTENDVEYQLVPSYCHRCNAVKRANRTFKEHFFSGLASVNPVFLFHLWDRLLPQAEMTLNLLRTSREHPQLSAAAHYHGMIDYNKTAFATPGCKIIAHEKPSQRRTWVPHGQHGYSLGPVMHHYRCQNVYITSMASERIVDTLEFFPHNYPMPQITSTDRLLMAANDMTNPLKHPNPDVPFATVGDDTITALSQLATIFKNKFQKPLALELVQAPVKADENKQPAALVQPILTSPRKHTYKTRSQHASPRQPANISKSRNSPLLPRVVTPVARHAASLRVPARTHNLSPRNFSQDDFWDMRNANQAIALATNQWTKIQMENAVVHPVTGN